MSNAKTHKRTHTLWTARFYEIQGKKSKNTAMILPFQVRPQQINQRKFWPCISSIISPLTTPWLLCWFYLFTYLFLFFAKFLSSCTAGRTEPNSFLQTGRLAMGLSVEYQSRLSIILILKWSASFCEPFVCSDWLATGLFVTQITSHESGVDIGPPGHFCCPLTRLHWLETPGWRQGVSKEYGLCYNGK